MVRLKFRQSRQPIKLNFFNPVKLNTKQSVRQIPLKNLTWPQASLRFPRMNPFGDKDRDGKLNMFDCRPFDKRRQGSEHKKRKWELIEEYANVDGKDRVLSDESHEFVHNTFGPSYDHDAAEKEKEEIEKETGEEVEMSYDPYLEHIENSVSESLSSKRLSEQNIRDLTKEKEGNEGDPEYLKELDARIKKQIEYKEGWLK